MKIYLPNNALTEDKAALEFIRGVLAGYSYAAQFVICDNPACDCGEVSFDCTPISAPTTPDQPNSSRPFFTLSLERRALARSTHPDLAPQAKRLARRLIGAM